MEIKSTLLNGKQFQSKSAMIKHLRFNENRSVSEIAKGEGILYQQVRNVCKAEEDRRFIEEVQAERDAKAAKK